MHADEPVEKLLRLTSAQRAGLKKLGIESIRDLLYHFPARYESLADIKTVAEARPNETAILYGTFSTLEMKRSWKTKVPMAEGSFEDSTGSIRVVWFHQPYLAKMIRTGELMRLQGKVTERNGKKYIANPVAEKASGIPLMHARQSPLLSPRAFENVGGGGFTRQNPLLASGTPENRAAGEESPSGLLPVYPETAGVTSLWFYHAIKRAMAMGALETIEDPLPPKILKTYSLPPLQSALVFMHVPKRAKDAEVARKRFAFEEVFLIQVSRAQAREKNREKRAHAIDADENRVAEFMKTFPFTPTLGQKKAIGEILANFLEPYPMSRLLEGDVGSGKTAVAAATAYAVVTSRPHKANGDAQTYGNLQVAYMCPTEILAKQHFSTFTSFFKKHPIQIGLITSSGCLKYPSKLHADYTRTERGQNAEAITPWTEISRTQLLQWVANGEIPILIGTHALIQKSVQFKNLAYVIIDEQHRFGTFQRHALAQGKINADSTRTLRGLYAEKEAYDPLLYRDLTYPIREAIFEVKKTLGLGHKESVYARALEEEFSRRKITFSREARILITYRGKSVGTYVPDFVIANKIVLELKALPFVGTREKKQLWNYLKGSPYRLGLLVNFSNSTVDIERVIYDTARGTRESASSPHEEKSASSPHLLSMTATPIPRTLALTIYGDLDLTILDELPTGRKPVKTEIITKQGREIVYEKIRKLIQEGRQAYVICPRIDEPDPDKQLALQARSVSAEVKRLQKEVFPEYALGKLHSKMTPGEKEEAMGRFAKGKTHILVATSVVEVGVNVPNATVIMIEGAERFGLAQLHQLRGRVQRSVYQPYCFLMVERSSDNPRLKAIVSAKNGFELAEKDLEIRGAGELYGRHQWGISDIGMDALKNLKLVEAARTEAHTLVVQDPYLAQYPLLKKLSEEKETELHFE